MKRLLLATSLLAGVLAFASAPAFADEYGRWNGGDERGGQAFHARDMRGGWQDHDGYRGTVGRDFEQRDEEGYPMSFRHHERGQRFNRDRQPGGRVPFGNRWQRGGDGGRHGDWRDGHGD